MFGFIRGLPDLLLLPIMMLSGAVFWVLVYLLAVCLDRVRKSVLCTNIRLKRENDRLRAIQQKYRNEIQGRGNSNGEQHYK